MQGSREALPVRHSLLKDFLICQIQNEIIQTRTGYVRQLRLPLI
ncbi:hypothetical protein MSKU9_1268 [Komagataeibacter diospyri]|uniref:Uncharacterized protein n=1 Tax=Komagataeibacter diospyri TaxID=1932662 RepID=A0A4P5NRR4_9PROT|nr:hypothetical protein MSKU9_1268 [Komagataeibacter diospyri]